jgi:AcrR family transcriptional regulator
VVIISIRKENKQETRERILIETSKLLYKNGLIKVSTKEIAQSSQVSQGSIFLHFKTKENLLNAILESNIKDIENALVERCIPTEKQDMFIKSFLNVMSEYENPLSRLYKDYPYMSDSLQKQMDGLESIMKNLFFDNLKNNRSTSPNIIDSFILIDAFVSQIKSYFVEKTVYTTSNSIIRQRRGRILKLFRLLFL